MNELKEQATLGGGCFWCLEAVFVRLHGVVSVQSGYAGGYVVNPSYLQVCSGDTGHAEVVQVTFDPCQISYVQLLEVFFAIHDPTTADRQGADVGPQYRSIILTHNEAQHEQAVAMIDRINASQQWPSPVVTKVRTLETFYPAEAEHHRYYDSNRQQGYCRVVIDPKIMTLTKTFAERLAPVPLSD